MKRRDFIKGFAAVSAAVPLASALASTKGAESVIKTYQMKDVKTLSEMKYTPETVIINSPKEWYTELIETNTIGSSPIYAMAYTQHRFNQWVHEVKTETVEEYGDYFSRFEFRYISSREELFRLPKHLQVIGLWDYWLNHRHPYIMQEISVRSMEIVTSDKIMTAINKNNKLV